ncbi:MAG TPA: maltose alpha-D-glucosyltransferase [Burkholderiales bacterium]|nr:maltose alpha-D-glucosyltransferase [Burkholderiales bacterium]
MDRPVAAMAATDVMTADDPLWYQDVVIYQLHVKAFFDSNDDGIGDFRGLTSKLDYIKELGVNAIWLLPFYPSPLKDDGYDVADYHNIHPMYGTRADFRTFMREAHRAGLKVITELVVNHTSDQHPWFQAARRAPIGSPKRDYYVWSDDPEKYAGTRIIFTDTEPSNWTWDDVAKQYFWHRFFSHQPDLNFDNPKVLQAVIKTMRFWLDMGVDGFRLDAIPYLIEREGTSNENVPETHDVVKKIRAALDVSHKNKLLLAEANMWPEDVREYFGNGDECHMAYHFPLMPRMYMAIAQEDRHPVIEIMQQTPEIPDNCQWAIFLRNHDELTLEMVTNKERDYMYRFYAADPRARINLGIRRRLAPLMENNVDTIKLMNSLLLSMPGSPIVYYGDEIGMGDNIFLGDRNGVRTPMQWSPDRNAGFSRADPQRLYLPPIMDPIYGFEAVNVEAQMREPGSLLNWMKRLLAVRKTSRAFGRGKLTFLRPGNRKILAYLRELGDEAILCVANLGRSAQPVELDLARFKGRVPLELLGRTPFPPIGELPYMLTLPAHSFYWFKLTTDAPVPHWHEERLAREDLPIVILFDGWMSFFRDKVMPWRIAMAEKTRTQLEEAVLPKYVQTQRWFAAKGEAIKGIRLHDYALWESGKSTWMIALFNTDGGSQPACYFLPLALAWEDTDEDRIRAMAPVTIARVRQQASVGILADAFGDERFARALVMAIGRGGEIPTARGVIKLAPTHAYAQLAGPDLANLPVRIAAGASSNSIVSIGQRLFLKAYRRVRHGVNPEVEIGRFLTDVAKFPNCVPLAGVVEQADNDGTRTTLAVLQAYVQNQGDAWTYTLEYVARFLDTQRGAAEVPPDIHGAYLALVQTLGMRTAELHNAFAKRTGDPAFDPEPALPEDLAQWRRKLQEEAAATFELLASRVDQLPQPAAAEARAFLGRREQVMARVNALSMPTNVALKTRHHGDYHLGQVLINKDDFIITDFEGEPARGLEERRRKHTPLRDVAGMLRSFDYAAAAALQKAVESPEDEAKLTPLADDWERQVRSAFLTAYDETARASGIYAHKSDFDALLAFFELEKALYELRYEINNRPDWVRTPLAGIMRLVPAG